MPTQFQSPELQAWASGFPITLLHVAVTLGILVVGYVWLYKKGALEWA